MIWDAAWTRRNVLDHILWDDQLYYIDRPNAHGWDRRWFVRLRFGPREITVLVLAQTFLTTPTGTLNTSTSDATWNNANNKVECIGAGGSGAFSAGTQTVSETGGGGGEYQAIINFTFATPGTTTFQWQVGIGGASAQSVVATAGIGAGNVGGDTWFNGTTRGTSSCGSVGGGPGQATAVPTAGGVGGTGGTPNTTHNNGGRGGNVTTSGTIASGGGGSGGPNGAGSTGLDLSSGATVPNGGSGDAGSGGAAGTGSLAAAGPGGAGGAGIELGDSIHGCGGGGGAARGNNNSNVLGGNGGLYGAGGGASQNAATSGASRRASSGAGTQGIIVLTWTIADVLRAQILL